MNSITTHPITRVMSLILALAFTLFACNEEEALVQTEPLAQEGVEAYVDKDVDTPEEFPAFHNLSDAEVQLIMDIMEEDMVRFEKEEDEVDTRFFFRNRDIFIFKAAVVVSGLWRDIAGKRVTAFAPSNTAFLELGIETLTELLSMPQGDLRTILEYHIIPDERLFSFQLESGFKPTVNGAGVEINVGDDGIFVNEQQVTRANIFDLLFFNSVIHKIDGILIPPSQNIVEIAVAASQADEPEFTQLVQAVVTAGLADDLSTDGPFTVFAPTDEAFAALLNVLGVNSVTEIDLATLIAVLQYHVVPARVFSSDLETGTVATLNGTIGINAQALTIDDNGTTVDANIIATDIQGTNGVIHVIDKVLLP